MIKNPVFFFNSNGIYENPIFFMDNKNFCNFEVDGNPRGKQRPRVVTRGGFARAYTPKETVDYENSIRRSYKYMTGNRLFNSAIEADIIAEFAIPKSARKRDIPKMLKNEIPYLSKPDCDNIGKVVLDGLNNIAYSDDSHVINLNAKKKYGKKPMIRVILKQSNGGL